ncbi:MAG TPA: zf-HC2 domain-containing protein [Bryobacteraceae bacterium]|nr:zf-HC2 domain-containing protein [Bryobacteraceae bacterium]HUA61419.1 zf-HC2 domain-containing protein [Verrucomicrobiae bacterium]
MHAVVMESLEDYLSGLLEPAEQRSLEAHLAGCSSCRQELQGMQSVSNLFSTLRPPAAAGEEEWAPAAGFYAGVIQEVGSRQSAQSFAGFFRLDFGLGRRLVLSSLLTLVLVGGWLVSRESGYANGPSPDAVLAQQDQPGFDAAPASQNMLATLTSYEH